MVYYTIGTKFLKYHGGLTSLVLKFYINNFVLELHYSKVCDKEVGVKSNNCSQTGYNI